MARKPRTPKTTTKTLAKRSKADEVNFIGRDGNPAPIDASVPSLMLTLATNPWVYAALYAISMAPTQVPFGFYTDYQAEGDAVENKEIQSFLQSPNPHQSYEDFIASILLSLETSGDVYIEWVIENGQREAYVLNPSRMSIVPNRMNRVQGYEYKANGKPIPFKPADIIHSQYPNPNDDLYGLSPLKAAEQDLISEYYAQKFNQKYFKQGTRMDGYLTTDQDMDDATHKRTKKNWKDRHEGPDNMWETPIFSNAMKYIPLGTSPKDMEFLNLRKWNREAVLAVLGVPPVLVGVFEYANYANSSEQKTMFWAETMMPKLKKLEHILTRLLEVLFETGLFFRYKRDQIPTLSEISNERATTVASLVGEGIITRDEGREMLMRGPYKDGLGDFPTIRSGSVPLSDMKINLDEDTDGDGIPDALDPDPNGEGNDDAADQQTEDMTGKKPDAQKKVKKPEGDDAGE